MEKREQLSEEEMATIRESGDVLFKLNLPSDFASYQSGNGEGIWALVKTTELKKQVDDDSIDHFIAYAANNSFAYPDIKYGSAIISETRNGMRPIAVWEDLTNSESAKVKYEDIKNKLMER